METEKLRLPQEVIEEIGKTSTTFAEFETSFFEMIKPHVSLLASGILPRFAGKALHKAGISISLQNLAIVENVVNFISGASRSSLLHLRNKSALPKDQALMLAAWGAGVYHPVYKDILKMITLSPKSFKLMLHGPAGTGKSSFWRVLEKARYSIVKISEIESLPNKPSLSTVYVIDDIDLLLAKGRKGASDERKAVHKLLEFLDEVTLVIITTNRKDDLDSAITRAGRIDHVFEVGNVGEEDFERVIKAVLIKNIHDDVIQKHINVLIPYVAQRVKEKSLADDGLYSPCIIAKETKKVLKHIIQKYKSKFGDVVAEAPSLSDSIYEENINKKPPLLHRVVSEIEDISIYTSEYILPVVEDVANLILVEDGKADFEEEDDDDSGLIHIPNSPKKRGGKLTRFKPKQ